MIALALSLLAAASSPALAAAAGPAAVPTAVPITPLSLASLSWEKIRETDGVTVYRSHVAGTAVLAFKGDGRVEQPMLKVAHVVIDPARGPEWVDSLAESRVLRPRSDLEFLEYDRFAMQLFVRDRDFVSRVTVTPDPATRTVEVRFISVDDPVMPPDRRYVRGDLVYSVFRLIDEGGRARN